MADIFRDQDHNLNKIVNADLTLIDPFLLPTGVLLSQDVLGATGITVIDNGDGTVTIGATGPTGAVGWLDDLYDVDTSTTGPTDGQVLLWNNTLQQWVPGEQAGGLGYRERFNVVDAATQLPLRVVHGLDVVTGVVDVTVAEMGPPTKLVQAEVTILDENTIDVMLPGVVTGSFEVLVLSEGEGGATGPSGPVQLIDEVFVGATDPFVTDPSSTAELWYTPLGTTYPTGPTIPSGVLRASVNGAWEVVSGLTALDDLTDVSTMVDGATGPTGPSDGSALVWDEAQGLWVPGNSQIGFWDPAENYVIDDMVLWPDTAPSSLWKASAANIDEEPTPSTTVEPDGIVFGGAAAGLSAGYRANTPKLASAGFEVRIQTDGTIGTGTLIAAGPGGSTLFKVQTGVAGFLQIVIPIGVGFTNDRALADFPSLNHIKIKVTGSTFNWYSSADGVEWTEVGTTMPNGVGIGPGEFLWISVGNDQGSDVNQNYAGVLRAVEIYNVDGTAPLTSWVRATQPDALGTGVSAKTGEIWDIYDPNGVMLDDPLPGTPSSWEQLIGGAGSINDLTDVDTSTTGPTGGSALIWDETVQQWVPGLPVSTLDGLTDVDTSTTGPTGGQVLVWDETLQQWVPGSQASAIDDLTDVDTSTTGPVDKDALVWSASGNQWIPGARSIDDLWDVSTGGATGPSGPTHGQVLTWDETLTQWVPGPTASEVEIGATMPTGAWELWVDEATELPTGTSGGGGANEVVVGSVDPYYLDPNSTAELWYDEGAVAAMAPPEIPSGGATNDLLTKLSATNQDVGWRPPAPPEIPAGGSANDVLTKLSATDRDVGWRPPTGTTFTVGLFSGFTGTLDFRVNSAMVTCRLFNLAYDRVIGPTAVQVCALPSGVPYPWGTVAAECTNWMSGGSTRDIMPIMIEVRSTGVWVWNNHGFQDLYQDESHLYATITWAR